MDAKELARYHDLFKRELLESVEPFWTNGDMLDRENGGIFSCLDREGRVYSTDKSVWFQGRCLWAYADLMAHFGQRPQWLEICRSCIDFMNSHCFDKDGRMFFTVTAQGEPLRKRRYYFSETFYIIGMAEYARVTGDKKALEQAKEVFYRTLAIYDDAANDPFKITPKSDPHTRSMKAVANAMILTNVTAVMRRADPQGDYEPITRRLIGDILRDFYKPELGCLLENVGPKGEFYAEISDGRQVDPGHAMEASWFIMAEAERLEDADMLAKALKILDGALALGWDTQMGGILYFADVLGKPVVPLEWDMKLWWPHNEGVIAALMAYRLTGDKKYEDWFRRITDYAFAHFPDRERGEWYGYLHRDGTVSHTLKGSHFKGPFHLFRMLTVAMDELEKLADKT
jgi:N-acylglucosamine 2-epimerase